MNKGKAAGRWGAAIGLASLVAGAVTGVGAGAPAASAATSSTGTISGVTQASGGGPAADVCAEIYPAAQTSDPVASGCSDSTGGYSVAGLAPGRYLVLFVDGDTSRHDVAQWFANFVAVTAGSTTAGVDAAMAGGGWITGQITDASTGQAISGQCVTVVDSTGSPAGATGYPGGTLGTSYQACTDSSGDFVTGGLATGTYYVQFNGFGNDGQSINGAYASQWFDGQASRSGATPVSVTAGQPTASVNGSLQPTVAVSGTVTDGSGPVDNATVSFYLEADGTTFLEATTQTAPDGTYTADVPAGRYQVGFQPNGGPDMAQWYPGEPDQAQAGTVTVVAGTPQAGVDAVLAAGASISGTVTDATTHNPVPAMTVRACPSGNGALACQSSTTGSDGSYTIAGLAAGAWTVEFVGTSAGSYLDQYFPDQVLDNSVKPTPLTVGAAQAVTGIDDSAVQGATFAGTVTDAQTGAPLAGVCVRVVPVDGTGGYSQASGCTGAHGDYTTSGVPTGSYQLEFTDHGGRYVTGWYDGQPSAATAKTIAVTQPGSISGLNQAMQLGAGGGSGSGSGSGGAGGGSGGAGGAGGAGCSARLASGSVVGMAMTADGQGYWIASRSGQVASCGDAPTLGNGSPDTVAIATAPSGNGYWLVTGSGQVSAFGSAVDHGGLPAGMRLNGPIVAMATDPATGGYWLLGSDGGVFSFDAPFFGSMGGRRLVAPAVGLEATVDGHGYRFVASDGGVFDFGDSPFFGSMGGRPLARPVVGMADDPATGGYWLVAADGGVFSFHAPFYGSTGGMALNRPVTAMTSVPTGNGYRLVATDGGIFDFGAAPFEGSAAG